VTGEGVSLHEAESEPEARIRFLRIRALQESGDVAAAEHEYDLFIADYVGSDDVATVELVAAALSNRSLLAESNGDISGALRLSQDLVGRFGSTNIDDVRLIVARALAYQTDLLVQIGDLDQAIVRCKYIDAQYSMIDDVDFKRIVCGSLTRMRSIYSAHKAYESEISVCDLIFNRYSSIKNDAIYDIVTGACAAKAAAQFNLGRFVECIVSSDKTLARGLASGRPSTFREVAFAVMYKGLALEKLERHIEARELYIDLILRYQSNKRCGAEEDVIRFIKRRI
jgi:tetratricopeptide (TPR) repeat protein